MCRMLFDRECVCVCVCVFMCEEAGLVIVTIFPKNGKWTINDYTCGACGYKKAESLAMSQCNHI